MGLSTFASPSDISAMDTVLEVPHHDMDIRFYIILNRKKVVPHTECLCPLWSVHDALSSRGSVHFGQTWNCCSRKGRERGILSTGGQIFGCPNIHFLVLCHISQVRWSRFRNLFFLVHFKDVFEEQEVRIAKRMYNRICRQNKWGLFQSDSSREDRNICNRNRLLTTNPSSEAVSVVL